MGFFAKVADGIVKIERTFNPDKQMKETNMDICACERIVDLIDMESRSFPTDERIEWKNKIKKFKKKVAKSKKDVKKKKKDVGKNDGPILDDIKLENMDQEDQMAYAKNIQEEDLKILERVEIQIEDTTVIATNAAENIALQGEQLQRNYNDLFEIDDTLKRAGKIVRRMLRRTASDKVVWFCTGLLFILIVCIVLQQSGVFGELKDKVGF